MGEEELGDNTKEDKVDHFIFLLMLMKMRMVMRGEEVPLLPLGRMAKKGGEEEEWWCGGWSVQRGDQRDDRDIGVGGRTEASENGKVDGVHAAGGGEVEDPHSCQGEEGEGRGEETCYQGGGVEDCRRGRDE